MDVQVGSYNHLLTMLFLPKWIFNFSFRAVLRASIFNILQGEKIFTLLEGLISEITKGLASFFCQEEMLIFSIWLRVLGHSQETSPKTAQQKSETVNQTAIFNLPSLPNADGGL